MSHINEDSNPFKYPENGELSKRRFSLDSKTKRKSSLPLRNDNPLNETTVFSPEDIPDEYERIGDDAGLLTIFNQEIFNYLGHRNGTSKDQDDLIDCFSRLRYEVRRDLVFNDLNKYEVEEKLSMIANMDHTTRNSLMVVFLTHGDAAGKLMIDDQNSITCEEVWNYFTADKCPSLKNKPKVFIFQACKGNKKATSQSVFEDSLTRSEAARKSYTLPAEADILVAYSTVEGNVSFRDSLSGTWFIQEVCKNFTAYGRRDDLATIITRVSKCVAYHYSIDRYKQMPCFLSTLTRKFYICNSKERHFMLDMHEQYKELSRKVDQMQRQLDEINIKQDESPRKNSSKGSPGNPLRQLTKACSSSKVNEKEKPRWK